MSYFENDHTKNYLLLQTVYKYFKKPLIALIFHRGNLKDCMMKVESPAASNSLAPALNQINTNLRVKVDGSCLKQDKLTFTHNKVFNICIACEKNLKPNIQGADFALGNY